MRTSWLLVLGVCSLLLGLALGESLKSYHDAQVWRCELDSPEAAQTFFSVVEAHGLDIWKVRQNETEVQGTKEALSNLTPLFSCQVLIPNVQDLLDQEAQASLQHISKRELPNFFDAYHPFGEVVSYIKELAAQFPHLVRLVPSIGKTVEGRDIPALRIKAVEKPKKTIFFNGGIHAREWVSVATVLFVATRLVEEAEDPLVASLLNDLEFVLVPCSNPDGYIYSWESDRLWRKNRRQNDGRCPGVDLNRNFDNHWGGVGASSYTCAEDYRGPSSASEPETQAIQNFVMSLPNRSGAIDFHAYGQLILRSFGYTYDPSPDEPILERIGGTMHEIIKKKSGKVYSSTRAASLYPTTGSTDDWFTETGGMWGWTIELRDTGAYGFRLPASQIIPTGEEIWEAMLYFSQEIVENGPVSN